MFSKYLLPLALLFFKSSTNGRIAPDDQLETIGTELAKFGHSFYKIPVEYDCYVYGQLDEMFYSCDEFQKSIGGDEKICMCGVNYSAIEM